jgi:hypothetical protein
MELAVFIEKKALEKICGLLQAFFGGYLEVFEVV